MPMDGLFQLILAVVWSDDPKTQISVGLVIGAGLVALGWVYLPLLYKLGQSRLAKKKLRKVVYGKHSNKDLLRDEVKKTVGGTYIEPHVTDFITKWSNSKDSTNRTPVRFASTFDERPLLPTGWRRSLLPSIPGIFLALGILGTFVGLTMATSNSAPTADGLGQQIPQLINSLSLAFRTSLWGIFLSISFVILIRLLEGAFEVDEESIDLLMHRAFPWISGSELTAQSLVERRDETSKLQTSLTEVAMSLENAITSGLEKIEEKTSATADVISQELIEQLGKTLQEGVGAHVESLRSAIEETTKTQEGLGASLTLAFEEMRQATIAHGETAVSLGHAAGAVENAAEGLRKSAIEFTPVVDNLALTGESLKSTSTSMAEIQNKSADAVDSVKEALQEAHKSLDQQRELVEGTLTEMRSAIEQLSKGLSDDLVSALRQVDGILGDAVGKLNGTIHDSNEMIDRLTPAVGQVLEISQGVRDSFAGIGTGIDKFGSQVTTSLMPIPGAIGELKDANAALVSEIKGLQNGLNESIKELGNHTNLQDEKRPDLALQIEKLSVVLSSLDKNFTKPKPEKRVSGKEPDNAANKPTDMGQVSSPVPAAGKESLPQEKHDVKLTQNASTQKPDEKTQTKDAHPDEKSPKKSKWYRF